jgi:hypothetical protein
MANTDSRSLEIKKAFEAFRLVPADYQRVVARADEKLTVSLELERLGRRA